MNGNVLGISMYTSVSSIVSVLFWNCSDSVVFYAFQFISSIVSVLFWNYSDSVIFYVFPFISTIFFYCILELFRQRSIFVVFPFHSSTLRHTQLYKSNLLLLLELLNTTVYQFYLCTIN